MASYVPACSQAPLGQSCCCCKRCQIGGCDLKLLDCGCCFHTRCFPAAGRLGNCPLCQAPARAVALLPMAFLEIDQAQAQAAVTNVSDKRGKKRKNATIARLMSADVESSADLRTGRWTTEETNYCDKLIHYFEQGALPIPDGIKLNDFLSNMLKSKQSRLTKKMKNARLSSRQYKCTVGHIVDDEEARQFSRIETEFFASIRCNMERSEIRFHMQKEWRELFSNYCINIGLILDANQWLHSVEELDRRASLQKDAARMARRKIMMGQALREDSINPPNGVFIDPNSNINSGEVVMPLQQYVADHPSDDLNRRKKLKLTQGAPRPPRFFSSAFIGKVIDYIQRHGIPFEHVDAWVPSFVPAPGEAISNDQKCRLCFAGYGTAETQVPAGGGSPVLLSSEDQFDLLSFGEYSQKFSFEVGSGLPGRVYSSGVSSWEQGIQNAPSGSFERKGGALQWDVQTVLGIPIPSPNVGRIVVLLYSRHDRPRDQSMVSRISEELTKLSPSPRWKLVVDVGVGPSGTDPQSDPNIDAQIHLLDSLIQAHTPEDKNSPYATLLPGFTSLRLLLLKRKRSARENELLQNALAAFEGYRKAGHADREVASLTARDFMVLSRQQQTTQDNSFVQQPQMQAMPTAASTQASVSLNQINHQGPTQLQQFQPAQGTQLAPASFQPSSHPSGSLVAGPAGEPSAAASHAVSGHGLDNISSYAMSPSLQALVAQASAPPAQIPGSQQDGAPLAMTASQLAAILQNDAVNYQN